MLKFLLPFLTLALLSSSAHAQSRTEGTYDHASYTGLDLRSDSELKFFGPDNVHSVGIYAPALTADTTYVLPAADGAAGQTLVTDGAGHLSWSSGHLVSYGKYTWVAADGSSKSITHNLNSTDLMVQVLDSSGAPITVDWAPSGLNVLNLSAVNPPTGSGWRVLILAL